MPLHLATRGGASVNDPRGMIRKQVREFMEANPNASFDEIEAACFPGRDRYDFSAISPRLFEAAGAHTGLILLKDEYLDGLEPYRHYIPLEPDFSNLDEVFRLMRDDTAAQEMIEAAYQLLVASERFSYGAFVEEVLADVVQRIPRPRATSGRDFTALQRHFERSRPLNGSSRTRRRTGRGSSASRGTVPRSKVGWPPCKVCCGQDLATAGSAASQQPRSRVADTWIPRSPALPRKQ